jgi:hypothetical protein
MLHVVLLHWETLDGDLRLQMALVGTKFEETI